MNNLRRAFTVTYNKIFDFGGKKDYLFRWSLWLPFGLSLKVHKIVRADNDRCEHDHPWWFIRLILAGGYTESIKGKLYDRLPWRPWAFWRIYPCLPSFQHKITHLFKDASWSLVLCGPNKGSWGFITKKGWKSWQRFLKANKKTIVLWCEDLYNKDNDNRESNIGPFTVRRAWDGTLDVGLKALGERAIGWEYGWRDSMRGDDKPLVQLRVGKLNILYVEFSPGVCELWLMGFWTFLSWKKETK